MNLKQLLQLPSSYDFQIAAPSTISDSDDLKTLQEVQNSAQNELPEIQYGKLNIENA